MYVHYLDGSIRFVRHLREIGDFSKVSHVVIPQALTDLTAQEAQQVLHMMENR